MAEIVYSNPVDVVSFSVIGMFDAFRDKPNFRNHDTLQIVILFVSLYKDGIINEETFNDQFKLTDLKALINKSAIDKLQMQTYLSIIEIISDPLSRFFGEKLSYFSFLMSHIQNELLNEHFPDIVDDVIYRFSMAQGRTGGGFLQPLELSRMMLALADLKKEDNIYNPFAGLASFGVRLDQKHNYYGQELNATSWVLGMLRLMAHNQLSESKFTRSDSILEWPDNSEKFNLIISSPPFGMRLGNQYRDIHPNIRTTEQFLIEKGIKSLKENGKLIALLPQGLLFRGMHEQRLRRYLVEKDLIDTIISLPGGLLLNTGIPLIILVLDRAKKLPGKVKFVDAKKFIIANGPREKILNDYSLISLINSESEDDNVVKIVDNDQIHHNDYNLSAARYFQKHIDGVKLADVVSVKKILTRNLSDDISIYPRINFSDLNNNIKLDYRNISIGEIKRNDFLLNESCFLLGTFNGQLKFSYFEFEQKIHICSGNMIAVLIDEQKVTVPYFAKQLTEAYLQDQIKLATKGSAIQKVSKSDLLKVDIKLPDIKDQERQAEEILKYFHDEDRNLQLLSSLEDQLYEQTVYLRHSIAGPTRNILSFMKKMMAIIDVNPKMLVGEIAEARLKSTDRYSFGNMREIVERDLLKIENVVKNQLDIQQQIAESKLGTMDIDAFLSEYTHNLKEVHSNIKISYESFVPYLSDDIDKKEYVTILGNPQLLGTMLDNFFENARHHAFGKELENKFLVNLHYDEDSGRLSFEVANSGKSFPKDFGFKEFIAKNKKSNDSTGNGYGGWFIYQVIKHHKGDFEIDDNSIFKPEIADGYTTSFHIQLPLVQD